MQQAPREQLSKPDLPLATIRLVRGSSTRAASWLLQAAAGGTSVDVGSDPQCEWPIRAAGVPPRALCLMLTELGLYARSTSRAVVRLNGHLLGESWEAIEGSARIDIGMASLEVTFSSDKLLQTLADVMPTAPAAIELDSDPDHSGIRPSYPLPWHARAPEPAPRSSMHEWRFSRYSLPDAPSVLGRYARPSSKFWLVLISVLVLGGYAGWVALLE